MKTSCKYIVSVDIKKSILLIQYIMQQRYIQKKKNLIGVRGLSIEKM